MLTVIGSIIAKETERDFILGTSIFAAPSPFSSLPTSAAPQPPAKVCFRELLFFQPAMKVKEEH